MTRVLAIARREFLATVTTRGFVIGLLLVPAIMSVASALVPRLIVPRSAQRVPGQVAIVDPTGKIAAEVRATLDPERIAERRADLARQTLGAVPDELRRFTNAARNGEQAIAAALGVVPDLRLIERPADADVQQEKRWLTENGLPRHMALVVVHPDAVVRTPGRPYGAYDLYVTAGLDDRLENQIHQSLRDAIVSARIRARALEPEEVVAMVRVARVRSTTVTKAEERRTVGGFNRAVPFIFVMLLFVGVMVGGQSLLTSTIEEKSSRVIEVLLSAVSPAELMAGKIVGQMGVSLVALGLYVGVGLVALVSFALFGLLDLSLLVYLVVFFVIAYLVMGSLMMAVGAAVNDMQEAQSLMMPIMLVMIIPLLLAVPISADPNSTVATVVSFIPPVNTFAMLIRVSSGTPPPWWQVWASIAIGIGSVYAAVWFAAKVFRILRIRCWFARIRCWLRSTLFWLARIAFWVPAVAAFAMLPHE
jgi:ABC-2 type transport system permease protein